MTSDARDPKWSAYVLSELDAADAARVEDALESSPEAQQLVADLRESADLLERALDSLPSLELSPLQRQTIRDAWFADEASPRTVAASPIARPGHDPAAAERNIWRRLAFTGMATGVLGVASVALLLAQPLLGGEDVRSGTPAAPQPRLAPSADAPPQMRLEITTPATNTPASIALSPDGRAIVYVAMTQPFTTTGPPLEATGESELWIRRIDTTAPRLLTRGHLISYPFWSPDGRAVGYFANGRLQRIGIEGGTPLVLADAPQPRGGAWSPAGTILFAPHMSGPLLRIAAGGGRPAPVTQVHGPGQTGHGFPVFLPDGERFLFHVQGDPAERGIHAGSLNSPETRRIVDADAAVPGLDPRQLLFVREGTLLAQDFDPTALTLRGAPSSVAEDLVVEGTSGATALSAAPSGIIVFRAGPRVVTRIGGAGPVSFSPDGRWIAYQSDESGSSTIWIRPLGGDGAPISLGAGVQPIWRADGSEVFFIDRDGQSMSVRIVPGPGGEGLHVSGAPTPLVRPIGPLGPGISPDAHGQLVGFVPEGRYAPFPAPPITVLLNWRPIGSR